ncbi:MAG TPA: PTS sugar transporter subunit IIC [Gemmatimonadales bacterium]|nr:PTS sugar transporter subunit IIC [Gemmatimonadales bacterium]
MIDLTVGTLALLVGWGTLVGLDLVSVPQGLLARPLVAASVAGWLLGDTETGLRVGALLELFALDVLPVGASRYPEYGPAAIGATFLAVGLPSASGLGVGVVWGLVVALVAGYSLEWLRHTNARQVHRWSAELDAGSTAVVRRLQWSGLARDAARSAVISGLAIALAFAIGVSGQSAFLGLQAPITPVLVGVGVASALSGALRTAGRGPRLAWLGVGVGLGILAVFSFGVGS